MHTHPVILKKGHHMQRGNEAFASVSVFTEIKEKRDFLKQKGLWEHSVDFGLQRLGRQPRLPTKDPLYLKTALNNYMDFHDQRGVRLPIHARKSDATLSCEYARLKQLA
jgi:hypothetical protein